MFCVCVLRKTVHNLVLKTILLPLIVVAILVCSLYQVSANYEVAQQSAGVLLEDAGWLQAWVLAGVAV